ncbi:MAG: DUF4442 domain-containing protein [Gammaproteobacteria bacterium]|nr:DUF4442 domain-containing protein [Gammaproteobacteria bacterium]
MSWKGKTIGEKTLARWNLLSRFPGGKWIFSKIVGRTAPYSGSIGARILDMKPGLVHVGLRDRKAVRNHLNSIHAIALANLGEIASGLAVICSLPPNVRGIVTNIQIEYKKKARGYLIAEGRASVSQINGDTDLQVSAEIKDQDSDIVAIVTVDWRLGVIE